MPPVEDQSFVYRLHESDVPDEFKWPNKFIEGMNVEIKNDEKMATLK